MAADPISVVIPVRNGAAFIAEAVTSALAQVPPVAQVIVVDDGSTDATASILAVIDDARLTVISGPAAGVSAARNAGFAAVTTEWVLFLDADDRLKPGAPAALLAAATDAAVAVYGDYERIDARGARAGRRGLMRSRQKPGGMILELLLHGNFIVNGGVMLIRTTAFRELGGFDASLRYCEDWYAWCRLAALGAITYVRGLHVLDYRAHEHSVMMHKALSIDDYRPALDRIFGDPLLIGKLDRASRSALYQAAEAHLESYLVAQAIRAGRYGVAAQGLGRTLLQHPGQMPRMLLMSGVAFAGL